MTRVRLLAASLALLPLLAHAQSVGRTLVSVGDVVAVRGVQEFPLRAGVEVHVGDTLRLGRDSNAQVRLNDESIISLRSETEFRIEEFRYRNDPASDNALFRLLRGGLRTVTGLIGRVNHDAYRLETPVGYVGIHGPHYTLLQCASQCLNKDGSVAPSGAYGGVSDGRIGVVNQSGEKVFGRDEYFYVASITTPPQTLIAPPSFLSDRLEGQARSSSKQQAAEAPAQAPAKSGTSSDGRTSTAEPVATAAAPATTTARNVYVASEQRSSEGGLTAVQPTLPSLPSSGLVFYPWASGGTIRDSAGNTGTLLSAGGIGIDFEAKRVHAAVNLSVGGIEWNVDTPEGIPIVAGANGFSFSGEFKQGDFPSETIGQCSQCPPGTTQGPGFKVTSVKFSGTLTSASSASLDVSITSSELNRSVSVSNLVNASTAATLERAVAMTLRPSGSFRGFSVSEPVFPNNAVIDSNNELQSLQGIVGPVFAERGTAAHRLVGSRSDAGDLYWGVWTGAGAKLRGYDYVTYTTSADNVEYYIHGKLTTSIPDSLGASVNYSPVGGVVNGGSGTFNGGTINVDFTQVRINLINLSATRASGETYVMNGASPLSKLDTHFGGGFASVTCSGGTACIGPMAGGFSGFLAGKNAEGIGLAFHAGNGVAGVQGVQAFKR